MFAEIAIENTLYAFDMLYTYSVPENLKERISAGARVVVPFGKGDRRRIGLVFSISEELPESIGKRRCKAVESIVDETPVISEELLKLCVWLSENTFCTYYDAFRAILPPGLGYSLKKYYTVNSEFSNQLTPAEDAFFEKLRSADKTTFSALISGNSNLVKNLTAKGALIEAEAPKRRIGDETSAMVRIGGEYSEKLTPRQKAVVEFVSEAEAASVHEVCYSCAVTPSVIKRLIDKNILERYENIVFRGSNEFEEPVEDPESIIFSSKQQDVFNGLLKLMNDNKPRCALLRGVTGSGKTSIFIRLISEALKNGKTALMMVPEISLTPQMVNKFRRLFGNVVAVMHSSLSIGERADEYRRIRGGKARIVIGTRSAVFAPLSDIGIIVMDEEGENSYKSESTPRYHARDAAKQRAFANNSLLLLASATPSLESYYNAKINKYELFEIDERYNNAVLPDVYIVDMQEERKNGNQSTFSMPLINELKANLERGEQSILLLNRRGYHTGVRCLVCGQSLNCPNCSIPMTYHSVNDCVICHYCGYMRPLDKICPKCGARFFNMTGEGTQLIEDEISVMFPKARVLRMDADTTSTKNAFEKNFSAFANCEYDIMVGTQMIAKGLDFPNVTLVGVLKTDNSLYAADFCAFERTFSLITQVVGRSGRGGLRGRAFIQTFSPDHFVINLAAAQNYPAFYSEEIELRRAQFYPPFCDIVTFGFSCVFEVRCKNAAHKFADMLLNSIKPYGSRVPVRVLGPAPDRIERLGGKFRYSLVVKCKNNKLLRSIISTVIKNAYNDDTFKNVSFYADFFG